MTITRGFCRQEPHFILVRWEKKLMKRYFLRRIQGKEERIIFDRDYRREKVEGVKILRFGF